MNTNTFVSLHNHTEYSFLKSSIRIKDLVKRAREFNMPALAITDNGGMFGTIEFYNACKKEKIKPIIGFEAYVAAHSRLDRAGIAGDDNLNHLILLACNNTGYKNLMRLSSIGNTEGFFNKPRIDTDVLKEYSEGLIATSACLAGSIPLAIKEGDLDRARRLINRYREIFGENNFYLELQNHRVDSEKAVFNELVATGREMGVPFIVTNDTHYLNREDAASHEILLCIQSGTTMADPGHRRFRSDQFYFKSEIEMAVLFPEIPEAMTNTMVIADRCNVVINKKPQFVHPGYPPQFTSEAAYLTNLARTGLNDRYTHITPDILDRLQYELDVIIKAGFESYILTVRDYVTAAKEQGIMTACRSNTACSLVNYAIGITDVDPIRYDLIFERFINPERVSIPDINIDFAYRDRSKVIDYVVNKYGNDHVSHIINFGRMRAKLVVHDVARVLGLPDAEAGRLTEMVEESIEKSLQTNSELQKTINDNPAYIRLFEHARALEGLARQTGMHSAGIVIAPQPVVNWAPLFYQHESGIVMTQYDMKYVQEAGLPKMDLLGLDTLTMLQDTVRLVRENHGIDINLSKLPDRDPGTFDLFSRGETDWVLCFESQGMQDNLRKLKPDNIEDLIAMNALYRPCLMDEIPTFIRRKHKEEQVSYYDPLLENTLKATYGVILYQEQIMRISQVMGGFSIRRADELRIALEDVDFLVMEILHAKFIYGAAERGVDEKIAQSVYDRMAAIAKSATCKAHATGYALLAYQCAYLKVHYPEEFNDACKGAYKYFSCKSNNNFNKGIFNGKQTKDTK